MTLTKTDVQDLIDRLIARGEVIAEHADGTKTWRALPILIGDIAKRIAWKYNDEEFGADYLTEHDFVYSEVPKLSELWVACEKRNENKSLQEIANRIEWVEVNALDDLPGFKKQIAKPSPETDLFLFLKDLNL